MILMKPDELLIDCVELKLQIQAEIASETEVMLPQDRLAYILTPAKGHESK